MRHRHGNRDGQPRGRAHHGALPHHSSRADTDGTTARAQAKGGSVVWEPEEHTSGRLSTVTDDQGAHFSILALTSG